MKRAFKVRQKAFFIIFKGLSVDKNCLKPHNAPLISPVCLKPHNAPLISPVWNKILKVWGTLFELIEIEVQCSKIYFKTFLPQEAGASGNIIETKPKKPSSKLKNMYIIYLQKIFALPGIQWK